MAEHWLKREWRKFVALAKDPLTWVVVMVFLVGVGLILAFLLRAANNFGSFYTLPYACSANFSQLRLFFLTMLAPLFAVAVFVTMAELVQVLGLRKQGRRHNVKFLLLAMMSMIVLGGISFGLLSC